MLRKLSPELIKKPLTINMINMVGSLGISIDLEQFYKQMPLIPDKIVGIAGKTETKGFIPATKKKKFYNCVTIYINVNNRILKVKVFTSGQVHMPGLSLISESNDVMIILTKAYIESGLPGPLNSQVYDEKTMFTTQYELNIDKFDGIKFCNILLSEYNIYAKYEPKTFPGVLVKFILPNEPNKNVITGIFYRSGKICINGANSKAKIVKTYKFINDILMKNPEILIKYN